MRAILKPFKINTILKYVDGKSNLKILDIGSGNHSAYVTKKWIPNCHYTGIDKVINYNNDEIDKSMMDCFIELDLTQLKFDAIPDNNFDVIIMNHVIEHLRNGDEVLSLLMPKLKQGGIFFIEFPSEKSVTFPSMRDTLNFFDDPTHCRIFSLKEICNIFMYHNFKILKAGKNRSLFNIFLIPVKVIYQLLKIGYVPANVFWDLFGFADYVVAKK